MAIKIVYEKAPGVSDMLHRRGGEGRKEGGDERGEGAGGLHWARLAGGTEALGCGSPVVGTRG